MIEVASGTGKQIWTPNDWAWKPAPKGKGVWIFCDNRENRVLAVTKETDIGTWEVLDGVHGGRIAQYDTLEAAKLGVEKFNLQMRK